jgi:hypothetical protein
MSEQMPEGGLAALIAGAGAADAGPPGGGIGAGGPPPGMPASIEVSDQGDTGADAGGGPEARPISILHQMIQLAQDYIQVEPDDVDKHTMMKVLQQLQAYLAKDQQDTEKAMGSSPAVKSLARATRDQGGF